MAGGRNRNKLTESGLRNFSEEHLHHEVRMLFETACRLRDDVVVHSDVVLKNSVIESFTIHARNVAAFLYPDRPNTRPLPDDVTVDHYVRDIGAWRRERGEVPPVL